MKESGEAQLTQMHSAIEHTHFLEKQELPCNPLPMHWDKDEHKHHMQVLNAMVLECWIVYQNTKEKEGRKYQFAQVAWW